MVTSGNYWKLSFLFYSLEAVNALGCCQVRSTVFHAIWSVSVRAWKRV